MGRHDTLKGPAQHALCTAGCGTTVTHQRAHCERNRQLAPHPGECGVDTRGPRQVPRHPLQQVCHDERGRRAVEPYLSGSMGSWPSQFAQRFTSANPGRPPSPGGIDVQRFQNGPFHPRWFCNASDGEAMTRKSPKKNERFGVDRMGRTELHYAALEADSSRVKELLLASADPNASDDNGVTPLHCTPMCRWATRAPLARWWAR